MEKREDLLKAKSVGKIEIAKNMLANNEPVEKIVSYTGLTKEEIKKIDFDK